MEKQQLPQGHHRTLFSATERTAVAAAIIAAIVLVGRFQAPLGAVLLGCSLALAFMVAKRWMMNRSVIARSLRKE